MRVRHLEGFQVRNSHLTMMNLNLEQQDLVFVNVV